jgi:predicted S18 family serine protease
MANLESIEISPDDLRALELGGIAVTVQIQPDGNLLPVGGQDEKLLAAASEWGCGLCPVYSAVNAVGLCTTRKGEN